MKKTSWLHKSKFIIWFDEREHSLTSGPPVCLLYCWIPSLKDEKEWNTWYESKEKFTTVRFVFTRIFSYPPSFCLKLSNTG